MLQNGNTFRYSSAHRHKKRYFNHPHEKFHAVFLNSAILFFRSVYSRLFRKKPKNVDWVVNYRDQASHVPKITWIGHSTFLIQFDDIVILTDPIFGNASPLFKRIFPPGIALSAIQSVNYILTSHNHRDHMDAKSLLSLRHHNPMVLVPQGDRDWFIRSRFKEVEEKIWWEATSFVHGDATITFTFLPAHHWSQRSLFDRNKSLWGSWMIQYKNYTIYFAGDTAYATHFIEIKEQFPFIDVALMPIGPCEPRKRMNAAHLSAEQAGQAFLDLGAQKFTPMHWGTFYFGLDAFEQPITYLREWWQQQSELALDQLVILKIGQQWLLYKKLIPSPTSEERVEL